jgi:hypothetical protein
MNKFPSSRERAGEVMNCFLIGKKRIICQNKFMGFVGASNEG